jgi:glycosyltransferase involved in cell wall biosynthesis
MTNDSTSCRTAAGRWPSSGVDRNESSAVTVAICTRNRPSSVGLAVVSVLESDFRAFQLLVVDQSDGPETGQLLMRHRKDPRFSYIASSTRGVAVSRNLAVRRANTKIVVFTDDDCEVRRDWLGRMVGAFETNPRVGLVFGNVLPGPHDPREGVLPCYEIGTSRLIRSLSEKRGCEGIGANMALRCSVWRELGGFDELLGTGGPLNAGEETDFTIRCLRERRWVAEVHDAVVVHHGFRPWEEALPLIEGYMYGAGAIFAKQLRRDPLPTSIHLAWLAWRWATAEPRVKFGNRPMKGRRLRAFLRGIWAGFMLPVRGRSGHFWGCRGT